MQPNKKHKQKNDNQNRTTVFYYSFKAIRSFNKFTYTFNNAAHTVHDYSAFRRHVRCHVKAWNFRRSMTS